MLNKHEVTIIWGTDREEETSYAFETQEELDAFLLGIAEGDGWWEYEIKEEAKCTDGSDDIIEGRVESANALLEQIKKWEAGDE